MKRTKPYVETDDDRQSYSVVFSSVPFAAWKVAKNCGGLPLWKSALYLVFYIFSYTMLLSVGLLLFDCLESEFGPMAKRSGRILRMVIWCAGFAFAVFCVYYAIN